MKHDLNPRWTTTSTPHNEESQSAEQFSETRDEWSSSAENIESSRQRIPVRRSIPALGTVIVGTLAGVCGIVVVGFMFLQGTLLLQASLTGEIAPDHIIMLLETGFEATDVEIGETVEFHNTLSTVEEYHSETPDAKTGMPLITTTTIPSGGSVRIKIPEGAQGKELLLMSGFHPARRGTINVADSEDSAESTMQDTSSAVQDTVEPDVGLNTMMPLPSLAPSDAVPVHENDASAQSASSAASPVLPMHKTAPVPVPQVIERPVEQMVTPLPEEILDLGAIVRTTPIALPWPSAIRTNRFTVGSALVPDLSHAVSIPTILGKRHSSAADMPKSGDRDQIVHRAPATGPELWVLILLSFAIVPIYLIRRRS